MWSFAPFECMPISLVKPSTGTGQKTEKSKRETLQRTIGEGTCLSLQFWRKGDTLKCASCTEDNFVETYISKHMQAVQIMGNILGRTQVMHV